VSRCAFFGLFLMATLLWAVAVSATPTTTPNPADTPGTIETPPAEAPPEQPASLFSLSGSMAFATRYLFQGIDYSNSKPVLEPEVDLGAGPIKTKLWVNHDLDLHVSNEFDFSVYHEWSAKKFSLATGYTYLWYPNRDGWSPSQELYADVSREGVLNPSLSIHYDFDAGMGSYSTFGLSHGFERPIGTVSLGVNLFYQDHYYGLTGFPSSEWNLHLERSFKHTTLTPSVSRFVTWANGDFRDENAVRSAWVFSFQIARDF